MRAKSETRLGDEDETTLRTPDEMSTQHLGQWILTTLLALVSAAPTCAPIEDPEGGFGAEADTPSTAEQAALDRLALHDMRGAQAQFTRAVALTPDRGDALIGLALTRLLLLPDHDSARALLTDLGGAPHDPQDGLYGERGLLALYASRAARSRVEARLDEVLPWPQAELGDPRLIADRLPSTLTGDQLADRLTEVAAELVTIADLMTRAARDPDFRVFVFPAQTFFGTTFIGLREPEVLALDGLLRLTAAAILWAAAYEWDLTPEEFNTDTALDDRVTALNAMAFKTILAPDRSQYSRGLLEQAMERFGRAVAAGFEAEGPGSLVWSALSQREVLALATFFADMMTSLDRPTALSADLAISLHLGALFDDRTLDETQGLLARVEGPEGQPDWSLDFDSLHSLLIEGIFTPGCHPDPEAQDPECPDFFTEGPASKRTLERLSGPLLESIEEDYRF